MITNKHLYFKNGDCTVTGYVVPKEFIAGKSLTEIERLVGFKSGRLKNGAAFAQLRSLPPRTDLDYYGSSQTPDHKWEKDRQKIINRGVAVVGHADLSDAAYHYLQPTTKLIKIIALSDPDPLSTLNQNWPRGSGVMQFKLKSPKGAVIVDVISNYPQGRFM